MRRAQAEEEVSLDNECKLAARIFIERFGEDAPRQASIRAAELEAVGDPEGYRSWMDISSAARKLLRDEIPPPSGRRENHASRG